MIWLQSYHKAKIISQLIMETYMKLCLCIVVGFKCMHFRFSLVALVDLFFLIFSHPDGLDQQLLGQSLVQKSLQFYL